MNSLDKIHCSFCGKNKLEAKRLISSNGVYICNICVESFHGLILDQDSKDNFAKYKGWNYTPKQLVEFLDDYVIGQERAKKVLSVAVYNHYKRLNNNYIADGVELEKSNILFIGPTGSGKTLLAKTLARILSVPFAIADATTLTEAGYVGDDVENIIKNLLSKCGFDKNIAQHGIIFIDEIDKISRKSDSPSITRDVSGEGVQQALLKIIEGTIASVQPQGGRKHPNQKTIDIDTSKILFIVGGAFDGLDSIISRRIKEKTVGFAADIKEYDKNKRSEELFNAVEPEDLIKFGLIPELVGRLPVQVALHELDEQALIRILIEPKNSLVKQFKASFLIEGVKLIFKKTALLEIVKLAIRRKIGARGLRSILEDLLLDTMFEISSTEGIAEVIIDKSVVTNKKKPVIVYKSDKKFVKAS